MLVGFLPGGSPEARRGDGFCWVKVAKDGLGAIRHESLCLFRSHPLCCCLSSLRQQRRATLPMMGIRGQEMNQAVVQESLRPVLGLVAKTAGKGARGHLYPCALARGLHEPAIMFVIQPGQSLWVGDNRYKPRG